MAPAPQAMFATDEKALCFHHELLYEAKVLQVRQKDPTDKKSTFEYKVHYKGWKNTWDDWVPQERLRKNTEENREIATNLRKEMEALQKRSTKPAPVSHKKRTDRASEDRQSSLAAGSRGQKRGRDFEIDREESITVRPIVPLHMPDRLKSLLVDDWENITKNAQLMQLPTKMPAGIILDEYAAIEREKRKAGSAEADILEEVVAGVKEYFNKALGRILLYRFERQQYYEIHKEIDSPTSDLAGKPLSDVYGGEHLLRLFVTMPELIAQTNMDQQSVNRLREELVRMTTWLAKEPNVGRYFTSEYESTNSTYKDKINAGG
ncbi:mortality factor 4-like protein-like protein 1 [Pseudovirgaria hyperparasitica]|uniref:Chromatin modification-related protein EAF3 n=1 Tax=Pseudovirgaria hyperparasitica TaxID=470096 RepID=A0A6A6WJ10_9PEZI|nr:mortality factor 4-like protein-like protein 1 [Pseudovirgaria hyperparasitica]KAF2762174.1 mortality factor 4-like protein-like protein 1 [Pseudovirgaria hyperparasitica]